ncbi:MAG: hypothetical protein U0574_12080 [Phycisphaerales bacterium]
MMTPMDDQASTVPTPSNSTTYSSLESRLVLGVLVNSREIDEYSGPR